MNMLWFLKSHDTTMPPRHAPVQTLKLGKLRAIVWLALLCIVAFFAWASWARLDQVTRAPVP